MAYESTRTDDLPGAHGGRRGGAGRKVMDGAASDEVASDFAKARARKEAALADLNELDYKIKSGEYIPRASVQQASAELLSAVAQALRSLPDVLERKVNLGPEAAEKVEEAIDAALAELSQGLEMFCGAP